ncbi:MAG: NifU family protein [Saprospiraceae bacterium]|nr:NifU family protein [Saprospiraceae bacterium]
MNIDLDNKLNIEDLDKVLDEIRPHLHTDGGDVKVIRITNDMDVEVEFLGNCQNCTLSDMTLISGVQETLKSRFPDIRKVIAVN